MSRPRTLGALLLPLLLAIVCAVYATWAAASSPSDTLLCNYVHPDCLSNHWLMVWVAEQVAGGGSILHNDRYYWPIGDSPWLAGNGSEGFAYLVWHALLGWPAASNVHLIGLLVLNGMAGWAVARAAGASRAASLAAVPTAACLLYAIHELGAGRFSQVSVCWLGFFLAAWLRMLDAPSVGRAALAAVLLFVTSVFYWYYGLFGVLAGAILLLVRRGVPVRTLAVFAGAYLVLIGPLLFVFARHWAAIPGTDEGAFPHPESLNDSTWPGIPFLVTGGRHAGRALPLTTVALACIGLFRRDRRWISVGLALTGLLFAGLMAGPLLPHGPYELLYGLARPLRRFWWPYRHVVVLNFVLIALAARGAERFTSRPWVGLALALSIPLQLTLQGAPWRAQFTHVVQPEPFYVAVASLPGSVLVEPPLSPAIASAQTQLMYQLTHRKALLGGHALWVDRVRPAAWDAFVAANSFLTEMQRLERDELGDTFSFEAADLRALIDADARIFVVNREYFPILMKELIEAYTVVFNTLFGEPVLTGKRTRAWDAARWDGVTAEVRVPPVTWPPQLRPGGPTLSIQAVRAPSLSFSIPAPPGGGL